MEGEIDFLIKIGTGPSPMYLSFTHWELGSLTVGMQRGSRGGGPLSKTVNFRGKKLSFPIGGKFTGQIPFIPLDEIPSHIHPWL